MDQATVLGEDMEELRERCEWVIEIWSFRGLQMRGGLNGRVSLYDGVVLCKKFSCEELHFQNGMEKAFSSSEPSKDDRFDTLEKFTSTSTSTAEEGRRQLYIPHLPTLIKHVRIQKNTATTLPYPFPVPSRHHCEAEEPFSLNWTGRSFLDLWV